MFSQLRDQKKGKKEEIEGEQATNKTRIHRDIVADIIQRWIITRKNNLLQR